MDHKEGRVLKNWSFQTAVLEKTLGVSWTARRSNQSIPKEINPEYSFERLMLKLRIQYFDHMIRRANSLKRTLMLGMIEGRKRKGQERMRCLDGITESMDLSLSTLQETAKDRKPDMLPSTGLPSRTQLSDWTTTKSLKCESRSVVSNSLQPHGL